MELDNFTLQKIKYFIQNAAIASRSVFELINFSLLSSERPQFVTTNHFLLRKKFKE
jgi:hypothetical protein